jgi:hypothetical protein
MNRHFEAGKEGTMRTIRVTGKGQIKVHPDMTRITMTLEGIYPEYADIFLNAFREGERVV